MTSSGSFSAFAGFRFPREVSAVVVLWYLRYGLSCRDVEEVLAKRGVTVDHVSAQQCGYPEKRLMGRPRPARRPLTRRVADR